MRVGESERSLPGVPEPPHQPGHPPATTRSGICHGCLAALQKRRDRPTGSAPHRCPQDTFAQGNLRSGGNSALPSPGGRLTRDAATRPGMPPRCSAAPAPGFPAPHLRGGAGRDGMGRVPAYLSRWHPSRTPGRQEPPGAAAAAPSEGRCVPGGRWDAAPPPPGPARPRPPPRPPALLPGWALESD